MTLLGDIPSPLGFLEFVQVAAWLDDFIYTCLKATQIKISSITTSLYSGSDTRFIARPQFCFASFAIYITLGVTNGLAYLLRKDH